MNPLTIGTVISRCVASTHCSSLTRIAETMEVFHYIHRIRITGRENLMVYAFLPIPTWISYTSKLCEFTYTLPTVTYLSAIQVVAVNHSVIATFNPNSSTIFCRLKKLEESYPVQLVVGTYIT